MLRPDNAATNEDHCAGLLYSTVQHSTTVQYSVLMRIIVQVSWIQKSSLHVLTSSVITFTGTTLLVKHLPNHWPNFLTAGDNRFSCLHSAQSDTWTLQIRYTQLRDLGEYQCQVNTEPKISMSVFLHVTGEPSLQHFCCILQPQSLEIWALFHFLFLVWTWAILHIIILQNLRRKLNCHMTTSKSFN